MPSYSLTNDSLYPRSRSSGSQPGVQQEVYNKLPLTHRVGQLDATDSEKGHPIHVRSLCCSRAPRAVPQRVPLGRASATRCSAAWSMAPAG